MDIIPQKKSIIRSFSDHNSVRGRHPLSGNHSTPRNIINFPLRHRGHSQKCFRIDSIGHYYAQYCPSAHDCTHYWALWQGLEERWQAGANSIPSTHDINSSEVVPCKLHSVNSTEVEYYLSSYVHYLSAQEAIAGCPGVCL